MTVRIISEQHPHVRYAPRYSTPTHWGQINRHIQLIYGVLYVRSSSQAKPQAVRICSDRAEMFRTSAEKRAPENAVFRNSANKGYVLTYSTLSTAVQYGVREYLSTTVHAT